MKNKILLLLAVPLALQAINTATKKNLLNNAQAAVTREEVEAIIKKIQDNPRSYGFNPNFQPDRNFITELTTIANSKVRGGAPAPAPAPGPIPAPAGNVAALQDRIRVLENLLAQATGMPIANDAAGLLNQATQFAAEVRAFRDQVENSSLPNKLQILKALPV